MEQSQQGTATRVGKGIKKKKNASNYDMKGCDDRSMKGGQAAMNICSGEKYNQAECLYWNGPPEEGGSIYPA